jgi:hypothetical protein
MSTYEQWQESNNRYLSAALADLRAHLERMADDGTARAGTRPIATPAAVAPQKKSWRSGIFKPRSEPALPVATPDTAAYDAKTPAPPASSEPAHESNEAADMPALVLLARRLGLSNFERQLLLLCAAVEFDTGIGPLCARAQHDASRPFPTFALAMSAFEDAAWDAMSPERPLRYWRLIEINQPGAQPLIGSALKADERIVNYLKGANYLDDRLAPMLEAVGSTDQALPPSQGRIVAAISNHLQFDPGSRPIPLVQLLGRDGASKLAIAQSVAAALGLNLYRINADTLPATLADQETFLRLWQRETALLRLALHVDAVEIDRTSPQGATVQRVLNRIGGVCLRPCTSRGPVWFAQRCQSMSPSRRRASRRRHGPKRLAPTPRNTHAGRPRISISTLPRSAHRCRRAGRDARRSQPASRGTVALQPRPRARRSTSSPSASRARPAGTSSSCRQLKRYCCVRLSTKSSTAAWFTTTGAFVIA